MTDDQSKVAGQSQPEKAWDRLVQDDSRRRAASRITRKDSAYAGWMVALRLFASSVR